MKFNKINEIFVETLANESFSISEWKMKTNSYPTCGANCVVEINDVQ